MTRLQEHLRLLPVLESPKQQSLCSLFPSLPRFVDPVLNALKTGRRQHGSMIRALGEEQSKFFRGTQSGKENGDKKPVLLGPQSAKDPKCMKRDCDNCFYSENADWRPSLHCALNQLDVLCLTCYRRFTILCRAPHGVSNEHSHLDRIFQGQNCSLDTEGEGGGVLFLPALGTQDARVLYPWFPPCCRDVGKVANLKPF